MHCSSRDARVEPGRATERSERTAVSVMGEIIGNERMDFSGGQRNGLDVLELLVIVRTEEGLGVELQR